MKRLLVALVALLSAIPAAAQDCAGPAAVCPHDAAGAMPLIDGRTVRVATQVGDEPGVAEAGGDLQEDLAKVATGGKGNSRDLVLLGTLEHNTLIDEMVADGLIDVTPIRGKWEAFLQVVVNAPVGGIDHVLVIVGSDRRGTIFGAYDLSRRIGVSPWGYWADVPVRKAEHLYVTPGARVEMPTVKYRGIFLNDEDPALKGWATATFGGLNHQFYERVFKLMLRLKANFLWPAMWGKSLWDDDPASADLASRLGIVLGTSHHEPLVRAHVEWERYGKGPWDYARNAEVLRDFWRKGMARSLGHEDLVTVGMRGDGDKPMTQGTATALLEQIVADQRKIIEEVTHKPAAETPQVWALYKEVQDYYDKGMRVPDDVTLLFSDDNWGNIRRLPEPGAARAGGYGVYYHFDYVGGPRNYKWINTNQISRVWEQMALAHAHGADRLWIVNVGDLKPMELPTSFFLDMAWNPEAMSVDRMAGYHRAWAAEQFGADQAAAIGDVLDRTTRYAARRKPELIDPGTWADEREAERVLYEYDRLQADADAIARQLPADAQDAYFELVRHPVLAMANLDRLYITVARQRVHALLRLADTNALADEAEALFANDRAIARQYEARAGGKWIHMMDQTHIGYTGWQQPPADVMPEVTRVAGSLRRDAAPIPTPWKPHDPGAGSVFAERDGVVAIEAEHFARAVPAGGAEWRVIPRLGRTAVGGHAVAAGRALGGGGRGGAARI
ncbi:MAG: glycosyl hydrolase 115 family protein [Sphingomonas sp.]